MTAVYLSSGVFDHAFASPIVWLTALLTAWTAVLPSVTVRALSVILKVHDKHKVRHEKVKAKALSVYTHLDTNQTHLEVGNAIHKNFWTQRGSFCPSLSVFLP